MWLCQDDWAKQIEESYRGCCADGFAQLNAHLDSRHVSGALLGQEAVVAFSSHELLLHYPCWPQGQLQLPELLPALQQYHLRSLEVGP